MRVDEEGTASEGRIRLLENECDWLTKRVKKLEAALRLVMSVARGAQKEKKW